MMKVDVFAHVLPPRFYQKMLSIEPALPQKFPFINHPLLTVPNQRNQYLPKDVYQIISAVNVNPEDYVNSEAAAEICQVGNQEIQSLVENNDRFIGGIAMLPMNNISAAVKIIEGIPHNPELIGVQIFTRALGQSIADEQFQPIFAAASENKVPLLLHPVFDNRKPDNNIVFSWEYEISQAMMQIVQADAFVKFPNLKIIVHHAGGMIPFFAERINHILPPEQSQDFQRFYVDTALLGNPKAIELAVSYFGVEHVLFGTDAPLGIAPAGATAEIIKAIETAGLTSGQQAMIFSDNFNRLFTKEKQNG
ncbi:MAG: amidohydrolase family protein [Limosilactobacillus pontis]|uniref:4-oxalomesaconate hydratase n=1 Tax=Limosilactobacillus pontis TaxID=35787 RepID=A0A2J6NL57_9LACO|nr:amidohydrolase family protein [Limosilactobacillus pontis]PMB82060.1 4-oxalomesaconate hydratase [Limosilactobacillus pontis]